MLFAINYEKKTTQNDKISTEKGILKWEKNFRSQFLIKFVGSTTYNLLWDTY